MHNTIKSPSRNIILEALFILAVAACNGSKQGNQAPPPPLVEIMEVKLEDAAWEPEFIGQAAGFLEVEIRARVGGILEKRIFEEGQFAKQGTQLFQIDPVPYGIVVERSQGDLAQAEAHLERTRREYVRVAALFEEDAVSEKERDDAEMAFKAAAADLQVAQANLHDAQVKLGYTRVDAPISGIVRKESCSVGTLVTTTAEGSLLTTMVPIDPLYINFSVPGADFARLRQLLQSGTVSRPGGKQLVTIVYPDGTLHPQPGTIVFTDSTEDPRTATVRAKVELPNPDGRLMPGQFVRVRPHGLTFNKVLLVPLQAIFNTQKGPSVYVVDKDMKAEMRQVTEQHTIGTRSIIFLKSMRATLIPCLAVPVSIIGAFAGMYAFGFSINTLTLFGLVLAIGIVVDDAIVVIENVERIMRAEGLPPREATIKAMEQVTGPIIAIVLVLQAGIPSGPGWSAGCSLQPLLRPILCPCFLWGLGA